MFTRVNVEFPDQANTPDVQANSEAPDDTNNVTLGERRDGQGGCEDSRLGDRPDDRRRPAPAADQSQGVNSTQDDLELPPILDRRPLSTAQRNRYTAIQARWNAKGILTRERLAPHTAGRAGASHRVPARPAFPVRHDAQLIISRNLRAICCAIAPPTHGDRHHASLVHGRSSHPLAAFTAAKTQGGADHELCLEDPGPQIPGGQSGRKPLPFEEARSALGPAG